MKPTTHGFGVNQIASLLFFAVKIAQPQQKQQL